MIYLRPTQTGYDAYDCYHELVFSEENCRRLFSFIESDTSTIRELLLTYFNTIIDAGSLTVKDETISDALKDGIKKEMEKIHPYLASNQYITLFRMLAEHLNWQIVLHNDNTAITKEAYDNLLHALVRPLYSLSIHPMPPIFVPTSNAFIERYYSQLKTMYEKPVKIPGLDYLEETRVNAERYIFWVLDRSCSLFKDIDRDTRVRLHSRIFRDRILGPDIRMEHSCYWREPEQYDYFSSTPSGMLLTAVQRKEPIDLAVSQITQKKKEKQHNKEMALLLQNLTGDGQELTQEMKDFLDAELNAAMSDNASALFEEYRADSFDQLIKVQLWLLTKGDTIIKKCRHCGRLFIPERLSSDYCSRIQENETEPCNIVGPKKSFARLMDEDHVLKTYNRVYKTIYARKKRGRISDEEFDQWKTTARTLLDKTRAGDMSEDAFETWLTQDIRAWG